MITLSLGPAAREKHKCLAMALKAGMMCGDGVEALMALPRP